jgi:hypothetical protein
MKKRITLVGVVLVVSLCICSTLVMGPSPKEALAADPVTLEVYNPNGSFQITQTFAPRLADLNGKTICEITNGSWEADRTFPRIRQLLQRQFPTAKLVPFEQFPVLDTKVDIPGLEDAVKKAGCQAAIVGNAG